MVLEVPTVQLESNAPTMLQGGSIQQMSDEKSEALGRLAKGQMQLGQQISDVAQKLQDERDDAVYTQKHNEYLAKVNEAKLKYASLEGENAIKTVGYDDDDNPITVLDQTKAELVRLSEEFEESLENNTQKLLFKTKAASTLNSANMFMTKHEISEFTKYRDNEFLSEIDIIADTTGQNYEDWHDGSGEFSKHKAISLLLAARYADNKGWPESSSQRAGLIQRVINKINVSTLNQMIAKKDFDDASAYLTDETEKGRVDAATYNTYAQKIQTGYNKQDAEIKANAVLTHRGDTNSGSFLDKANRLFTLSSFNALDDGTGRTVKYGFKPDERNTSNINETDAKEFLEQLQNTSKYYQEDSNLRLLPQHQTIHLFVGKQLSIKKADAFFSKAKRELVAEGIDLERIKNDPTYAKEFNAKLIDKVISYTNEDMSNKIGDHPFAEKIANDLQLLKSDINYDYDPNDGLSYRTDEKTGMPLLADRIKILKDIIKDPEKLPYAIAELERNYKAEKAGKEEIYDANLEAAKEIAFSENNAWTQLADNGIDIEDFTREDQRLLKNGHPEESDTNTYAELLKNPTEILPENIGKYRGLLSKSDYRKFLAEGEKLKNGGENKIIAVQGDTTMLHNTLNKFKLQKLYKAKKGKKNNQDYIAIQQAWHEEINYMQEMLKRKVTYTEKENALEKILLDKVSIDNRFFDAKNKNIYYQVDEDRMDDVYVTVQNSDGESINVFPSEINDDVITLISKSLRKEGRPATQTNIAEMWILHNRPKSKEDVYKFYENLDKEED